MRSCCASKSYEARKCLAREVRSDPGWRHDGEDRLVG